MRPKGPLDRLLTQAWAWADANSGSLHILGKDWTLFELAVILSLLAVLGFYLRRGFRGNKN